MPLMIARGEITNVEPGSVVKIFVEKNVGMAIGTDGIVRNDKRLKISCNAKAGAVLPVSIFQSPDVGYFSEKSITFSSSDGLIPSQPVALALRFEFPSMCIVLVNILSFL